MTVSELVNIIQRVCGLPVNWAKTCIYYCMATHKLSQISWMVVLIILAPPGSGKSWLINVLRRLSFKAYDITCFDRMTSTTLRNELAEAKNRTAIIEEGDLYPRRKELETYLINRVDKKKTSTLPVTAQFVDDTGATNWRTGKVYIPGATILHDRHQLTDLATERRAIIIPIKHQKDKIFYKPTDQELRSLSLPRFSLGDIPDIFNSPETSGSALDAWEPLIRIASSLDDWDWLIWALERVAEANEALADGYQYELEQTIFGAIIKGYYNEKDKKLLVDSPLPLSTVTEFVKREYPWVAPKTVGTSLRKLGKSYGLYIGKIGGVSKIFTTEEQLRKIAEELNYQDEALE